MAVHKVAREFPLPNDARLGDIFRRRYIYISKGLYLLHSAYPYIFRLILLYVDRVLRVTQIGNLAHLQSPNLHGA